MLTEPISPELALVDPELARAARAQMPPEPWQRVVVREVSRPEPVAPRRSGRGRRVVAAIAATLVAAGGIVASAGIFPRADDRPRLAQPEPTFTPSRTFAWTPVPGAEHYRIRFYHGDRVVLEARPSEARYELPEPFRFDPGVYRWTVEPSRKAGSGYRKPIVASSFVVRD